MDFVTLALIAVVIICSLLFIRTKKSHPGKEVPTLSPCYPLVGNILNGIPKWYSKFVEDLQIGPVYKVKIGSLHLYRLNSYHAIHEALIGQGEVFSGRFQGDFSHALFHDSGVVNTDGPVWQEHRRLLLRLLREFGLGRSVVTDIITDEVLDMMGKLRKTEGEPVISQDVFSALTSNVIAKLIFGEKNASDDEKFKKFMYHLNSTLETRLINTIPFVFPITVRNPLFRKIFDYFSGLIYHMNKTQDYVKEKIVHQEAKLREMDPPPCEISQASNVCEALLIEKNIQEENQPGGHTFTDWQMIMNMADLFTAGTETTSSTLNWAMLLLSCNPDVQSRLHREIEDKIGNQKTPTMSDRHQLPFVCATMDEIMRVSSLVPLNVMHRTTQDTTLLGYFIPGDSLVQTNMYGVHHDPEIWKFPKDFYPEHFLAEDGKYRPSKYLIPFSLGKRACLGESLARTEYFIAFTSIVQKFKVRLADSNVDLKALLNGTMGIVRHPLHHEIIFETMT